MSQDKFERSNFSSLLQLVQKEGWRGKVQLSTHKVVQVSERFDFYYICSRQVNSRYFRKVKKKNCTRDFERTSIPVSSIVDLITFLLFSAALETGLLPSLTCT